MGRRSNRAVLTEGLSAWKREKLLNRKRTHKRNDRDDWASKLLGKLAVQNDENKPI